MKKIIFAVLLLGAFFTSCSDDDDEELLKDKEHLTWVDLGLSVKWASGNLGADCPEGAGMYFAWGETLPKTSYDVENSLAWHQDFYDITGSQRYDAAHVHWGREARIPTANEFKELVDRCSWKNVTMNGVNGMQVTGPNGNKIFLPAAGYCIGIRKEKRLSYGLYWCSTPYITNNDYSFAMKFDLYGKHDIETYGREYGLSIRPVHQ